jgi:GNAT superfamily N-acetyltransferase
VTEAEAPDAGSGPPPGSARAVVIRPLRRADLPAVVALRRRIWPDLIATAESAAWEIDHADPAVDARRWVATVDRKLVGAATAGRATWSPAGVASAYVGVEPAWRTRGIGGRLFDLVVAHVGRLGAARTLAGVDRGDAASAQFLANRGFHHNRDLQAWSVDPSATPLDELPARRAAAEAAGLRLVPVRRLVDRPEDLYRFYASVERDLPTDDPIASTFWAWRTREFDTPLFDPDASFCVLDSGDPVAIAWIFTDREGRRAAHGLTGTLPTYRHRGLARLAKLASLAWLADHGVTVVYTDNDSTNGDMLALNEHLGFRPLVVIELWARDGFGAPG